MTRRCVLMAVFWSFMIGGLGGTKNDDSFDEDKEWVGETGECMHGSWGETERGGCVGETGECMCSSWGETEQERLWGDKSGDDKSESLLRLLRVFFAGSGGEDCGLGAIFRTRLDWRLGAASFGRWDGRR